MVCLRTAVQGSEYAPLHDVEEGRQLFRTCMKKAASGNIVGLCRDYLATEMLPNVDNFSVQGVPGAVSLMGGPQWELLHKNTKLHNPHTGQGGLVRGQTGIWKTLQPGSERTAVLTLIATALGSGVLALPSAFARVGLVVGVANLTLAVCLSCVSLNILMVAGRYTEAKSFAELLTLATGSTRSGLVLDVLMVVYGFCAILALLMFEGDFIPAILDALGAPNPGRTICVLVVAACAWPFVLPPRISALRYVASLSPVAILFVAGNVVSHTPIYYSARAAEDIPALWRLETTQMLQASSIFVFSVMCHANAVPVATILDRPSVERIVKVTTYSNTCMWVLYILIGVGGYLSFASTVQGDFLLNYPVQSIAFLCCRVLLAIVCYVGIPVNSPQCAQALHQVLSVIVQRTVEPKAEERPVLRAFLASLILAASTVSAVFCTDVAALISLVGGSLATLQMFWLPACVYWKILYPTQPKVFRRVVMGLMIMGGIAGFSSVACSMFV